MREMKIKDPKNLKESGKKKKKTSNRNKSQNVVQVTKEKVLY